MANYEIKYQCVFDPPEGGPFAFKPRYRLEILQKEYSGPVTNILGGETPVLHRCDDDNIKAPVRGTSLEITLINEGNLPLRSFYSVNDDEFKVRMYWIERGLLLSTVDNLWWEGFIVQDDCSETMVDFKHTIKLSANDGLGLLKDVSLDKTGYDIVYTSTETYEITYSPTAILLVGVGFGSTIQGGDKISIDGGPLYTVSNIVYPGGSVYNIYLAESPPAVSSTTGDISIYRYSLYDKVTLLSVIRRCLSATGLELKTNIYCNLLERLQVDTSSFLDQTLIDVQTFLKDGTDYKDCYQCIEEILGRFHLSLFQAEGVWNIVRWDELRYYANAIPGFSYNSNMILIGAITLPAPLTAEPNLGGATTLPTMYPLYELINRIFRPFKFTKETFNYRQPPQLLRNYDLQQLGTLLASYSTGGGVDQKHIKEYAVPWWYYTNAFPTSAGTAGAAVYIIRVTTDYLNVEIERTLIVSNNSIHSYKIEVNKGDFFTYSFSFRTAASMPGNANFIFYVKLTDGTQTKYIKGVYTSDITTWENTPGYTFNIASGDNAREWHTVTIKSAAIPFDGLVYVYLSPFPTETHYKDIRFDFTFLIAGSGKVKGHTHTSTQTPEIKQSDDVEIFMDTTSKNSVVGTLFLNAMNGLLQKLTTVWKRAHIPLEQRKLGNITTFEQLFWRRLPRTILEASYKGLIHSEHRHISMLTVMRYNYGAEAELNFLWGKFEMDYKHDMINNSPLHEAWKDGEVDTDLTSEYENKYIYETK